MEHAYQSLPNPGPRPDGPPCMESLGVAVVGADELEHDLCFAGVNEERDERDDEAHSHQGECNHFAKSAHYLCRGA